MGELRETARVYRVILASRLRAQRQYRASFTTDILGSILLALVEFGEVWIIFHNVRVFGGQTMSQSVLQFGIAQIGYAGAQLIVGHVDRMPAMIRTGTLEVLYLRPLSVLGQILTSELQLRRIGWAAVATSCLTYGLIINPITWSLGAVTLLALSVLSSIALFAAIFTAAGAAQFWLVNAPEVTNAFTYGGRYASQQPMTILPRPLLVLFTALVPVAFAGYLPMRALLGLPAPEAIAWLDPRLAWAAPVVAGLAWLVTGTWWRLAIRHYQGAGG